MHLWYYFLDNGSAVRTSFGLRWRGAKTSMYQRKVGVYMLNAVKSVLADVSSVSPWSEQKDYPPPLPITFVCVCVCGGGG